MGERREANTLLIQARQRCKSEAGTGHPMSRQELAEAVNAWQWETHKRKDRLDERDIGKLERGEIRWPGRYRREGFRAVLGARTDAELGFYPGRRPQGRQAVENVDPAPMQLSGTVTGGQEDVVQRRTVLHGALTALAAGAVPALDAIRYALVASVAGDDQVELDIVAWEEVAHEYESAYYMQPSDILVSNLAADLADLQIQLRTCKEQETRVLARIGGQLAALLAMSLVNIGQFHAGRRWWQAARRLADASTDPVVRTWVRGQEATHAIYSQRPLTTALSLADEAIAISGPFIYPGTMEAMGSRAQALALLSRGNEAREAMVDMHKAFDQLPADAANINTIMSGWPERRLWHTASYVYTELVDRRRAAEAQRHALVLIPDTAPRSRAQVELHMARCLVQGGHLDDGIRHAQQAVTALPAKQRTALVLGVGHAVVETVPAKERSRPAVVELRELLTAPSGAVTT